MKMKRSFRVMLCPNNKQETRLFQYAGTCRFVYNWALAKEMGVNHKTCGIRIA